MIDYYLFLYFLDISCLIMSIFNEDGEVVCCYCNKRKVVDFEGLVVSFLISVGINCFYWDLRWDFIL